MMQDFKTAHLLGVSPRAQFYAMLLGSGASVFVSVAAYALYTAAWEVGLDPLCLALLCCASFLSYLEGQLLHLCSFACSSVSRGTVCAHAPLTMHSHAGAWARAASSHSHGLAGYGFSGKSFARWMSKLTCCMHACTGPERD